MVAALQLNIPLSRDDTQRMIGLMFMHAVAVLGVFERLSAPYKSSNGVQASMEDSPTTQMRQRRASTPGILLDAGSRQHEPLTAARGILLGAGVGAVSLGILVLAVRAIWRYFA
jgi:hypothetical protein